MAARFSPRAILNSALIALAVAVTLVPVASTTFACSQADAVKRIADASSTDKSKVERECHKRTDGQRTPAGKACPDGGERLPQDKRSPLDSLPPLAPLVA